MKKKNKKTDLQAADWHNEERKAQNVHRVSPEEGTRELLALLEQGGFPKRDDCCQGLSRETRSLRCTTGG